MGKWSLDDFLKSLSITEILSLKKKISVIHPELSSEEYALLDEDAVISIALEKVEELDDIDIEGEIPEDVVEEFDQAMSDDLYH